MREFGGGLGQTALVGHLTNLRHAEVATGALDQAHAQLPWAETCAK